MRRSKFTEAQIIDVVREYDAGVSPKELARRHGIHANTIRLWKANSSPYTSIGAIASCGDYSRRRIFLTTISRTRNTGESSSSSSLRMSTYGRGAAGQSNAGTCTGDANAHPTIRDREKPATGGLFQLPPRSQRQKSSESLCWFC